MRIEKPAPEQVGQLLSLWKTAFGDHSGFWEMFLETGFRMERCRCVTEDGGVTAALYWFDCLCQAQKCAYLYAVVTHPEHRGRGLCRQLLEDTQKHLRKQGYASILLVPERDSLRQMYRRLGYRDCTSVTEFHCGAGKNRVPLRAIGPAEFAALRRELLPHGGVIQEEESLSFLEAQAAFFAGEGFLLAAYVDGNTLHGMELLGDQSAAPGIVAALDCKEGYFRSPGRDKPFAMIYPLTEDAAAPEYFGLAFD